MRNARLVGIMRWSQEFDRLYAAGLVAGQGTISGDKPCFLFTITRFFPGVESGLVSEERAVSLSGGLRMFLGKIGLSKKAIAYAFLSTVLFTTALAFVSTAPAFAEDMRPVILVGDFTNETKDVKWDTVGIGLAGVIAVKLSHLKCV